MNRGQNAADAGTNEEMRRFFNQCAPSWDGACGASREKIAAVVTLAGVRPGVRVADIACGTGILFAEILERGPEEIFGIDLSDAMIARARVKFSDPRIRLAASDVFAVRETGFDIVTIFSAYPHFSDKRRLAEQAAFMLKPGGRLLVAHCESRTAVNGHHMGRQVRCLSTPLRPVREEAEEFSPLFSIDMLADTDEFYFFSGTKRQNKAGA